MKFEFLRHFRSLILFAVLGCATIVVSAQTSYPVLRTANNRNSYSQKLDRQLAFVSEESSTAEQDVFKLVNYQRLKRGLPALKWHSKLAKVARKYSKQMADEDFFGHFEDNGDSVVDRAEKMNIKNWKKLGENLFFAEGYISPTFMAVDGWMKSKGHKMNILDDEWTHTGVGVYETRGKKTFFTQVFMKK